MPAGQRKKEDKVVEDFVVGVQKEMKDATSVRQFLWHEKDTSLPYLPL